MRTKQPKLELNEALSLTRDSFGYLRVYTFLRTDSCGNTTELKVLGTNQETAWYEAIARANRFGPYPTGCLTLTNAEDVEVPSTEVNS